MISFVTCQYSRLQGEGDAADEGVPIELVQQTDDDSLGDLTMTTHEMRVEIEQFKQKIADAEQTLKTGKPEGSCHQGCLIDYSTNSFTASRSLNSLDADSAKLKKNALVTTGERNYGEEVSI